MITCMRIRARNYATAEPVEIICNGGLISSVGSQTALPADLEAGWVAPALFDLQINGCDGHSFNSDRLTIDAVRHVVTVCRRHGIGSMCPTLVTNAFAALEHGLRVLRQAFES